MDEAFFTGYCRSLDGPRTVTAELWEGQWEYGCAYPDCPFADSCPIAKELSQLP